MQQVFETLRQILAEHFLIRPAAVQPSKSFWHDLGLGSLEFTELVVQMEETYGIQLSDAELAKVRNVRDMVVCVEKVVSR